MSISIRIPPPLHERVVERATKDIRSLNAEIQWLLTFALETLERQPQPPAAPPGAGAD